MSSPLPIWMNSPGTLMLEDSAGRLRMPRFLRVIEEHLLQVAAGLIRRLIINVPFQHGKPLAVSSLVLMGDGRRVSLGEVRVGDNVIGDSGRPRQVLQVFEQGKLPVLEIRTVSGRLVKTALDHPFLTTMGYRMAKDLRPGDYLALVPHPEIEDSSGRSDEEFALAGYFVGDGSTNKNNSGSNSCRITSVDQAVIKDFTRCGESLGFEVKLLKNTITYSFCRKKGTSRKLSAAVWVREAGLVGTSWTKRVPEWVFRGSAAKVSLFLAAYFACDGCVNASGKKRIDCCCEFYSVNEALLRDVQHLLLRIGVRSRLRRKLGGYAGRPHWSWRLALTSLDDVTQFAQSVPLIGEKRLRLEEWAHKLRRKTFPAKYLTDEIESVELAGVLPCRCLSVAEDRTFTAEDLVVHNTTLCTKYFLSWWLLNWPDTRILLGAHETMYAKQKGGDVRDVVNEWGPKLPTPLALKQDTQAKDEWRMDGFDGGMVSKGMKGSVQGRPADLFVIEDPYKDFEDYMSRPSNEQKWNWYSKVAYQRCSNKAPIIIVSTPWGRNDLCARLKRLSRETNETWTTISYKAIAEENDPLDRKPGEALWPERVSLERLHIMQKQTPSQFRVSYQMEDGSDEGTWFKPRDNNDEYQWPLWVDLHSGAYSYMDRKYGRRRIYSINELIVYVIIDWAYGKKKWSDYTAMGAFALTPLADVLILEVVHKRFGLHELAPALAEFCTTWHPALVACESGHPTLRDECNPYPQIPEVRWLSHQATGKLQRAHQAIVMGENGRLVVPADNPPWLDPYLAQLMAFTGINDEHEDMVDMTSYAADQARLLRALPVAGEGMGPCVLTAGRMMD